jgi:hypothetical protein
MSLNKPDNFRAFVPFILNRRVYSYSFDPNLPEALMRIPMRRYQNSQDWTAEYVDVYFQRRTRKFVKQVEKEVVEEVYYTAFLPNMRFENSKGNTENPPNLQLSPIPVIQ